MKLFHKIYPNETSSEYLFILHGLFGMLDNWHNMARKLSKHLNVVTVDQRNHGKSPHSDEMSFELMAEDLATLKETVDAFVFDILGLVNISKESTGSDKLTSAVEILIALRKEARLNKDFALSDKIRDELAEAGIQLKDSREGTTFTF